MREVLKKVRHKGKVVAELTLPVYENVKELVDAEPPERVVAMFNNGNHIRIMSNERMKYAGTKAGKRKRYNLAFNSLTVDELMSVAQDADKLQALIESPEVQARVDALLQQESGETEAS